MLDGLIMFGLLFFWGLLILGVTGLIVDRLSRCQWVDMMFERMIHE